MQRRYIFFFQLPVLPELVMRLTLSTLPASMYRYLRRPASYSDSDKMVRSPFSIVSDFPPYSPFSCHLVGLSRDM
jgi:hypothetical protein